MDNKEQSYYNIKKVKQFLLDNNAYHSYLYNLYKENHFNNFDGVLDFFSRHIEHTYRFIDFSFTWCFTKEDEKFWLKLHKDAMNEFFKK